MTEPAIPSEPRHVAISGASGLVGQHLTAHFEQRGWRVSRLVRRPTTAPNEITWTPEDGRIDGSRLEGLDGLVHLAGASLTKGRWTAARKQEIWDSRVQGTRTLAEALLRLETPPRVWLSISGVGFYGSQADRQLDESSPPGQDYLATLCQAWEAEALRAKTVTRVITGRLGVLLTPEGGALAKMLPFFRAGLGGQIGNGKHYLSWIAPRDLCRAVEFCLETPGLSGPVNLTGPNPVTNRDFTRALGSALHRPAILPVPPFALRLAFGEFASDALASLRVAPKALLGAGFEFEQGELAVALAAVLGER